jgi:hypothetical protein
MVTISKLGSEVDTVIIKIDKKIYVLSENSNKLELYLAVKELSRVILLNQIKQNGKI